MHPVAQSSDLALKLLEFPDEDHGLLPIKSRRPNSEHGDRAPQTLQFVLTLHEHEHMFVISGMQQPLVNTRTRASK